MQRRPNRTLGRGYDEFWASSNRNELRLPHCARCNGLTWPPINACEFCGSNQLTWQAMSGRGKIVSWCTFEHDYYGGILPIPYDTILVQLEEGPLFLSNPDGFNWRDIEFGMPVSVKFTECADAAGVFNLPVFERA